MMAQLKRKKSAIYLKSFLHTSSGLGAGTRTRLLGKKQGVTPRIIV